MGIVSGFVATNHLDREKDIFLSEVLEKGAESLRRNKTVFINHMHWEKPLGKIINSEFVEKDGFTGIHVDIGISKGAADWFPFIDDGTLNKFSIGFYLNEYETEEKDGEIIGTIKDADILEASIVGIPANEFAETDEDKNINYDTLRKMFIKTYKEKKIKKVEEINEEQYKELMKNQKENSESITKLTELLGGVVEKITKLSEEDNEIEDLDRQTPLGSDDKRFKEFENITYTSKEHEVRHQLKSLYHWMGQGFLNEENRKVTLIGDDLFGVGI